MATTREYVDYVMEQFEQVGNVTIRPMMGEYVLYYRGRVFGGLYDNRLMIKPLASARCILNDCEMEIPHPDAQKEMIRLDDLENPALLFELLEAMYPELPEPKPRAKKRKG